MRIIRFVTEDGRVVFGVERGDNTASVVADDTGLLARDSENASAFLSGKRAVVADDDEVMRRILATILNKVGCECVVCCDGAEAMSAIESQPVDLVVSDIVMPHHNGYEIFATARRHHADIPIVLITGFGYDPNHSLLRAAEEGHHAVLYKPFTPQQLIEELRNAARNGHGRLWESLQATDELVTIMTRLPPIDPSNILCVGRNYPGSGVQLDQPLEVFMKPTSAVIGDNSAIRIPRIDETDPEVDFEGELAVILGTETKDVSPENAFEHVVGLTIANDVTARRWQTASGPSQWMRGKGFDTFCPLGPVIVTVDELPDLDRCGIRTKLNGELMQEARLADMVRPVQQIIAELSSTMTLSAGTVILTGTPAGAGGLRNPPRFLRAGDEVTVEIDGIGTLRNAVIDAD